MLVVVFDDVDLHFERSKAILESIPVILSHPAVTVLIAADLDILRTELARASKQFLLDEKDSTAIRLADDQLRKRLPKHLRTSLPIMTGVERIKFTPQGVTENLLELMRSIRIIKSKFGPQTFADFFDISWNVPIPADDDSNKRYTLYANFLPDDPRSLTQLYRMIANYRDQLIPLAKKKEFWDDDEYKRIFYDLIKSIIDFHLEKHPDEENIIKKAVIFEFQNRAIHVNPEGLDYGISRSSRLLGTETRVGFAREYWVRIGEENPSLETTALLHFLAELSYMPLDAYYEKRIATPGRINSYLCDPDDRKFGWPMINFDSFLLHFCHNYRWEQNFRLITKGLGGIEQAKIEQNHGHILRMKLLFGYLYCCNEVARKQGAALPVFLSKRVKPTKTQWDRLTQTTRKMIQEIRKEAKEGYTLASEIMVDYSRWVLRDLAWLTFKEVVDDNIVRDQVTSFRHSLIQMLDLHERMVEGGLRDAQGYLAEAKREMPILKIEDLDMEELLPALLQRDQGAISTVLYALRTDTKPSATRARIEALLRQLGIKVPEALDEVEQQDKGTFDSEERRE